MTTSAPPGDRRRHRHDRHPALRARQRPENSVKLVVPSATRVVAAQIREATGAACPSSSPAHHGRRSVREGDARPPRGRPRLLGHRKRRLVLRRRLAAVTERGLRLIADDEVASLARAGAASERGRPRPRRPAGRPHRPRRPTESRAAASPLRTTASARTARTASCASALGARPRQAHALEELFWPAAECRPCSRGCGRPRRSLAALPRVTAADTGPAALLGALGDDLDRRRARNVGNCHTICVVALEGRCSASTRTTPTGSTAELLETMLRRFLAGDLDERRGARGRRARGRPRRPRARRPAHPGHRPATASCSPEARSSCATRRLSAT